MKLLLDLRREHFFDSKVRKELADLTIKLSSDRQECSICNTRTKVLKTQRKICYSYYYGVFKLIERQTFCEKHKYVNLNNKKILKYHSAFATEIAEKGFKVTFDLIVKVGLMRFKNHMQLQEIQNELTYGPSKLDLPTSTISLISIRFLEYLKLLHEKYEYKIKAEIDVNGGYFMHFDGTTEVKSRGGVNLVIYDTLSDNLLGSYKIDSEKYANLVSPFNAIKKKYGQPYVTLSDLKSGFLSLSKSIFNVHHIFCHYHFLRTFKDCFHKDYEDIKNIFSKLKIRNDVHVLSKTSGVNYRRKDVPEDFDEIKKFYEESRDKQKTYFFLLTWISNYKKKSSGKGIPFDLPAYDLYSRFIKAKRFIDTIFENDKKHKLFKFFNTIAKRLEQKTHAVRKLHKKVAKIKYQRKWFNELRAIFYLTKFQDEKEKDLSPLSKVYQLTKEQVETLPSDINTYLEEIDNEIDKLKGIISKNKEEKIKFLEKISKQVKKYEENLRIPVIKTQIDGAEKTIIPQRTNNTLERFFRKTKTSMRRKTGRTKVTKEFSSMGHLVPYFEYMIKSRLFKKMFEDENTLISEFVDLRRPLKVPANIIAIIGELPEDKDTNLIDAVSGS